MDDTPLGLNFDTAVGVLDVLFTSPLSMALIAAHAYLWGMLSSYVFLLYLWAFLLRNLYVWLTEPSGPQQKVQWEKQVVVVTGGSHGVGCSLLKRLSLTGARIANLDVSSMAGDLPNVFFYQCDLSDTEQITKTVQRISDDLGVPTMLVNNAGVVCAKLIHEMTEAEMQHVMQVNAMAPMHLTRLLLPGMLRQKNGHVVFVASVLGFAGLPQAATYAGSKALVANFRDSLRLELRYRVRSERVKTSVVFPGKISSGMFDGVGSPAWLSPEL
ncbi:hypothetical protein EC988_006881, partial [Linderina pennispora]